jgi:uncharacterized protein YecE (DUF72 family)
MAGSQSQLTLNGKPLYIGPAGWSYEDSKGIVYPEAGSKFDVLGYVSRFYNTLEVNVSFYRFVTKRMSESWVRRVADPDHFLFTYKLNQRFTHARGEPYSQQEVREFKEGIAPAAEAGMLGALLAQFPWSFRHDDESVDYLKRIKYDFAEYPVAVEVRHRTWEQPEAVEEIRDLGLNLCTVDQPRMSSNLGPLDATTGPVAYVRLHGRNAAKWFADDIESWERYDYFYPPEQLEEVGRHVRKVAESADRIFVIANNHYKGQGAANALQLRHMLTDQLVDVPPTLAKAYPDLAKIARTPPALRQEQRQLF